MKHNREEIYANLVEHVENTSYRYTRCEMTSYCIGYYKVIDETIWNCISQLYADGFIDS